MTGINCSFDCIYQQDGKCCFENISSSKISSDSNCAYFVPKRR